MPGELPLAANPLQKMVHEAFSVACPAIVSGHQHVTTVSSEVRGTFCQY